MAVSTGKGFMAMLEQATRRGHELDERGYSDVMVGARSWSPPKRDGSDRSVPVEKYPSVRPSWDVGTAGTSSTTAGAFTGGTITAEALEALARDIADKTGTSAEEFFKKEYLSDFGMPTPKGWVKPPVVPVQKKTPVLAAVSDPIALPEYLLADLADEAELGRGSAERGGW